MSTNHHNRRADPPNRKTLILFWRSLGPYHVARATAAAEAFAARGVHTIALELCDADEMHQWEVDRATLPIEVRTIAPQTRLFNHLPSWAGRVIELLDDVRPAYVAVAGWTRPEMRAALRWAGRHGATAVLMSETKWDDRPRTWWKRAYAARQVRRAQAALVSGGPAGEYLVSLGMPRERIFRQYGAVDNAFFARHSEQARQQEGGLEHRSRRYFVACCRLVEVRKNLVRMLLAYERYRQVAGDSPWELVVCGDGPDAAALRGLVAQRGIEGVCFAGAQQADGVAGYYAGASCFIHPAMNEAWGLVVNEALAAGLPVLVSRRCGCAYDLVDEGGNGWTFNPYDVEELARLMARVGTLTPEALQAMGRRSEQVIRRFGVERFGQGLLDTVDAVERMDRGRGFGEAELRAAGLEPARAGVAADGPRCVPGG